MGKKIPEICQYEDYVGGFGWYKTNQLGGEFTNTCTCIMAVALQRELLLDDLIKLVGDNVITQEQLDSIQKFDDHRGTDEDLKIIKKLATKEQTTLEFIQE